MTKEYQPYFDPDKIVLKKVHLKKIIDAVIIRWQKNTSKHRWQIKALQAFRFSLRIQSDESIELIFKELIKVLNEMQYLNSLMVLKDEFPSTDMLLDLTLKKIDVGEFVK